MEFGQDLGVDGLNPKKPDHRCVLSLCGCDERPVRCEPCESSKEIAASHGSLALCAILDCQPRRRILQICGTRQLTSGGGFEHIFGRQVDGVTNLVVI